MNAMLFKKQSFGKGDAAGRSRACLYAVVKLYLSQDIQGICKL